MGAIVRKRFYDLVRAAPFGGRLTPLNFEGTEAILSYWESFKYANNNLRALAYVLATVFHETAGTMDWAIPEYGKGHGKAYGKPVPPYDQAYYGRSWPQLTWDYNYKKMWNLAKQNGFTTDFYKDPDALLKDKNLAAFVLFEGMYNADSGDGDFTGKSLEDYFQGPRLPMEQERAKAMGARRVVNGTDKAAKIAGYYTTFLDALEASYSFKMDPVDVVTASTVPGNEPVVDEGKPISQTGSLWGTVGQIGGGAAMTTIVANAGGFFSAINNPWSLAAVALAMILIAGGGYLVISGRLAIKYKAGV